jgi:hypothetical protein
MLEWFKKDINCYGSVLYRGTIPPGKTTYNYLKNYDIEITDIEAAPDCHWALNLTHKEWGEAILLSLRDNEVPPGDLIDYSYNLTEDDRNEIKQAGSIVSLKMKQSTKSLLKDRKNFLFFLNAVIDDFGIAAIDHQSQRFWTRGELEIELSHNADLDIDSIISFHSVTDDKDEENTVWLHTHGLAEIGFFDFDIVDPSEDINSSAFDALRSIACMIVEGSLTKSASRVALGYPDINISTVPVEIFNLKADDAYKKMRHDPDAYHENDRVVICEPVKRFLGGLSRKVTPHRFLSKGPDEEVMFYFSNEATILMSERARGTYSFLRKICDELKEFDITTLLKIGYIVDGGGEYDREHLWFTINEFIDNEVDAELVSEPFNIERMKAGEIARHSVEGMSDWKVFTPFGEINPRQTHILRFIRSNRDNLIKVMNEYDESSAE